MIMDFQDPLRMNRDAFPFSNTMLALFAAITRFGFHLMSMYAFFTGTVEYSRDFGRTTPYDFCDLDDSGLMRLARQNQRAKGFMTLNPNWIPFFDGMFFDKDAMLAVSPYNQLLQDLRCPNPEGYSKLEILIAATIDFFFLPYEDPSVSVLRDISDGCGLVFLFFIVEEFVSTNWVAVTVKKGIVNLLSFVPVYLGILVASSMILRNRFGGFFMQFKKLTMGFLNVASWALSTPKNHLDEDVDFMNDNQSLFLGIYFIMVSFFVLIIGANVFISIVMEAYTVSRLEEGTNFKYIKPYYYIVNQKEQTLRRQQWFRDLFRHMPELRNEKLNFAGLLERLKESMDSEGKEDNKAVMVSYVDKVRAMGRLALAPKDLIKRGFFFQ